MDNSGGGIILIEKDGFEGDGRLLGSLELSNGGHGESGVTVVFRGIRNFIDKGFFFSDIAIEFNMNYADCKIMLIFTSVPGASRSLCGEQYQGYRY